MTTPARQSFARDSFISSSNNQNQNNRLNASEFSRPSTNLNDNSVRRSRQLSMVEVATQDRRKKIIKWGLIAAVVALVILLAIIIPVELHKKQPQPTPTPPGPDITVTIYNPYYGKSVQRSESYQSGTLIMKKTSQSSEFLQKLRDDQDSSNANHQFVTYPLQIPSGVNNPLIQELVYNFSMVDSKTCMLTISDAQNKRFSIDEDIVPKLKPDSVFKMSQLGFHVATEPFAFKFTNPFNSSEVYLHNEASTLLFMDKFIQMDLQLPSQRLYGLGERSHQFPLTEGTWTMWSKGNQGSTYDDGTGGLQGAGVHPFILVQTQYTGWFFGLFFRNANAQSPLIRYKADGGSTLSYITLGGQIELQIYTHGIARQIVKAYHMSIGRSYLPPFWALGWHQSSGEYADQDEMQGMMDNYKNHLLPLDGVWLNWNLWDPKKDFTINQNFGNITQFVSNVRTEQKKMVMLVKGAISANFNNTFFNKCIDADVLIQSTINENKLEGKALIGQMWRTRLAYLDLSNPQTQTLWQQGLESLFGQLPFDGINMILTDPYSGISGEIDGLSVPEDKVTYEKRQLNKVFHSELKDSKQSWYQTFPQSSQSTYYLPFIPGFQNSGFLDNQTISLNATQPSNGETQYNMHSLYGHMMASITYTSLTKSVIDDLNTTLPFIVSTSTFASSGRYTSHLTGSTEQTWDSLKQSISSIMNFDMFGIPHTGANICGTKVPKGQTSIDQELCLRWIQLATFYPLARFHYDQGQPKMEPYNLNSTYMQAVQATMLDRYQYLRLMYTCLFEASDHGESCFEPLFFYFPFNQKHYSNIEQSFMVAGSLKVSPILSPMGQNTTYQSYFPRGNWVDMNNFSSVINATMDGVLATLQVRNTVNVHLKDGSVIAFQNASAMTTQVLNAEQLRHSPITIIANRDTFGLAKGTLFIEKTDMRADIDNKIYEYYQLNVQANTFQKQLLDGTAFPFDTQTSMPFGQLVIVNANDLQNVDFACMLSLFTGFVSMNTSYNSTTNALYITPTSQTFFTQFKEIVYGNSQKDFNPCSKDAFTYNVKGDSQINLAQNNVSFLIEHQLKMLPDLLVNLTSIGINSVNIKWTIANLSAGEQKPFEVPLEIIEIQPLGAITNINFVLSMTQKPFSIQIFDEYKVVIYEIKHFAFDHYLNSFSAVHQTLNGTDFKGIMGLGERMLDNTLFYQSGVYSIWNRGATINVENGKPPGNNLYSTHPFYIFQANPYTWAGVYQNIASAQDWYIHNDETNGKIYTTMIAAGGIMDLSIVMAGTPAKIIQRFHQAIGKPVLFPYWAFGWHQSRWGYQDTAALQSVVDNYASFGIPLDGIWSDIDYMEEFRTFTIDQKRFKDLPQFVQSIQNNLHYIPILNPAIAIRANGTYPAFDVGVKDNVFIKMNDKVPYFGYQWCKDAFFPDWFNPNATAWWHHQLSALNQSIQFDGVWEELDEVTMLDDDFEFEKYFQRGIPMKTKLKYTPTGRDLGKSSIILDAYHYNNYTELDTHSLFGGMETKITSQWFIKENKRPFVISRSSFTGVGKHGGKLQGDNAASVYWMAQSVLQTMNINMFGIHMTGADICGFNGDTNPELCARWHFVGAFQPLSRNHNSYYAVSQEPYVPMFNQEYEAGITYTDIMTTAIKTKYHLLKYFYTFQFTKYHSNGGKAFYQPLFFEFPNDTNAYANATNNVMLGDALKVGVLSNALNQNQTYFYYPAGIWCDIFDESQVCINSTGSAYLQSSKAYDFYVHLREGHIIPIQNATKFNINSTKQLQDLPVDLHILGELDSSNSTTNWKAKGNLVNDNGDNLIVLGNTNYQQISVEHKLDYGVNQIEITFSHEYQAFNYSNSERPLCYNINGNDFLGAIHIHNAIAYKLLDTFYVFAEYIDGEDKNIGKASYDDKLDRLIFNGPSEDVCFPALSRILFIHKN